MLEQTNQVLRRQVLESAVLSSLKRFNHSEAIIGLLSPAIHKPEAGKETITRQKEARYSVNAKRNLTDELVKQAHGYYLLTRSFSRQ